MCEELSDACESGDVDTIQACLARGEDVNARNSIDKTPLITAVWIVEQRARDSEDTAGQR
jgi:hypothetical protein